MRKVKLYLKRRILVLVALLIVGGAAAWFMAERTASSHGNDYRYVLHPFRVQDKSGRELGRLSAEDKIYDQLFFKLWPLGDFVLAWSAADPVNVIDCRDPSNPKIGRNLLGLGDEDAIKTRDNKFYAIDGKRVVVGYDVSDPLNPVRIETSKMTPQDLRDYQTW